MRLFLRATVTAALIAMPALADPQADRRLLAETIYSDGNLDASFQIIVPMMSGSIESEYRKLGITISDPAAFADIFTQEFRLKFTEIIRADMAESLKDYFTDEELADIVAFLRTPTGAKFFGSQAELTQLGARLGESAGMRAGMDAADRIAARMDAEGVTFTDTSGAKLDALLVLRGY